MITNASRFARSTVTATAFSRFPGMAVRTAGAQNPPTSINSLSRAFSHVRHQQQWKFLPTSSQGALKTTATVLRGQSSQGILMKSTPLPSLVPLHTRMTARSAIQQHLRTYSSHQTVTKRRRPLRFLFKVMAVSAALVAAPAVLIFGAPVASLIVVPIAVGGLVGGIFLLTGGLLVLILPIVTIGGAITLSAFLMPAMSMVGDLNKILKRASSQGIDGHTRALTALGPEWEIQPANANEEWFRWTFPASEQALDKISVRMAVFDPEDKSGRKQNAFRFLDRVSEGDKDKDKDGENTGVVIKKSGRFEVRNNSNGFSVQNMSVKRERDHFLIEMEDDGAKLLDQTWGKRYLELAQIVDKAASELEAAQPGLKLGDQVVLVKKDRNSFWSKFSLYGNLHVRVPFSRTWVHDVVDE
ncbi:hypothetical protein BGZ68_009658 [Mortierella alpina]|nr:hypothetical protein BGZ68_009658 [Mortierella alpina]